MPTVILLDVSLSMNCTVTADAGSPVKNETSPPLSKLCLAKEGILRILDHLYLTCKLEFVSLVTYSSHIDVVAPFTRDHGLIKTKLQSITVKDKTCLLDAVSRTERYITDVWGIGSPCQLIVVSDGSVGIGPTSLVRELNQYRTAAVSGIPYRFPLPFQFLCSLHFILLSDIEKLRPSLRHFDELITIAGQGGRVFHPPKTLSKESSDKVFKDFADVTLKPREFTMKCGHLQSTVTLMPPISYNVRHADNEFLSDTIDILGFIGLKDIGSPPVVSRHMIIQTTATACPAATNPYSSSAGADLTESDEGKIPSFSVLLHGSLKVEGMVAVTQIGVDWFAILFSHADSRKRSSLTMCVFDRGALVVPWLGDLNDLLLAADVEVRFISDSLDYWVPLLLRLDYWVPLLLRLAHCYEYFSQPESSKPPLEKCSYEENCVIWIRPSGLQTDIQKVLRNARRLPEKISPFYKELNRLRRAALSFGFNSLLESVAEMLSRECHMLPGNAHPAAALQLDHAASSLLESISKGYDDIISPLATSFGNEPGGKNALVKTVSVSVMSPPPPQSAVCIDQNMD